MLNSLLQKHSYSLTDLSGMKVPTAHLILK